MSINSHKNNSNLNSQRAFTMVELLVSVALFTIVMLISVAVVFSIIGGNRKAQSINAVVNNLNFSIESMVRDMKTGYYYKCDTNLDISRSEMYTTDNLCTAGRRSPQTSISFVSLLKQNPEAVKYEFVPGDSDSPGRIFKYTSARDSGVITGGPLTSPDVDIKSVRFYIDSPAPGSGSQPSVFILISGTAKSGSTESDFIIQTFVSQRLLNIGL